MYLKFATSESQQVLAPENSLACVCVKNSKNSFQTLL